MSFPSGKCVNCQSPTFLSNVFCGSCNILWANLALPDQVASMAAFRKLDEVYVATSESREYTSQRIINATMEGHRIGAIDALEIMKTCILEHEAETETQMSRADIMELLDYAIENVKTSD